VGITKKANKEVMQEANQIQIFKKRLFENQSVTRNIPLILSKTNILVNQLNYFIIGNWIGHQGRYRNS
jgi:hypothetical protein